MIKNVPLNDITTSMLQVLHMQFALVITTVLFTETNAIEILKSCLRLTLSLWKLFALMILAYVANDSESGLLASTEQSIHTLTDIVKSAVNKDSHKNNIGNSIFSVFETLDAINHLAINDDNKVAIANGGVIPDIIKILKQSDFSVEERRVAAESLWNLTFIESLRKSVELQAAVASTVLKAYLKPKIHMGRNKWEK